jgi:hypothetical protein
MFGVYAWSCALPHRQTYADAKLVLDSIGFETVIIEAGKHVGVLS